MVLPTLLFLAFAAILLVQIRAGRRDNGVLQLGLAGIDVVAAVAFAIMFYGSDIIGWLLPTAFVLIALLVGTVAVYRSEQDGSAAARPDPAVPSRQS